MIEVRCELTLYVCACVCAYSICLTQPDPLPCPILTEMPLLSFPFPFPNQQKLKGDVSKTLKTVVLLCNFGPFCAIIITSFIAYGMDQRGVGPQVVGKVPQGMHMFQPYNMSTSELQVSE